MPKAEAPKAPEAPKGEPVLSKLGEVLKLYGFLRLDMAYDSTRSNYGNLVFYTLPNKKFTRVEDPLSPATTDNVDPRNNSEFNIHSRFARLGLSIGNVNIDAIKAKFSGRFEFDFYGVDFTLNDYRPLVRNRLAYGVLEWDFLEIHFGQDWDLVSPLNPNCDINSVGANAGNIGHRRPAFSLQFKPKVADKTRLWVQVGLARAHTLDNADNDVIDNASTGTVGEIDAGDKIGDGNNDGEDRAVPMVQWRVGIEAPTWTSKPVTFGVSGHWEQTKVDRVLYPQFKDSGTSTFVDKTGARKSTSTLNSYSVAADLSLPLLEWGKEWAKDKRASWILRGEFFYGQDLADLYGGVGQGINRESLTYGWLVYNQTQTKVSDVILSTIKPIKSMGGWVDTTLQPFQYWTTTLGFMIDMPFESTLPKYTYKEIEATRYANQMIYFNNAFELGAGFSIGAEYDVLMTKYKYADWVLSKESVKAEKANHPADGNRFRDYRRLNTYWATDHRLHTYLMYNF